MGDSDGKGMVGPDTLEVFSNLNDSVLLQCVLKPALWTDSYYYHTVPVLLVPWEKGRNIPQEGRSSSPSIVYGDSVAVHVQSSVVILSIAHRNTPAVPGYNSNATDLCHGIR